MSTGCILTPNEYAAALQRVSGIFPTYVHSWTCHLHCKIPAASSLRIPAPSLPPTLILRTHTGEVARREAALQAAQEATGSVALERQQLLLELARLTDAVHALMLTEDENDENTDVSSREQKLQLQQYAAARREELLPLVIDSNLPSSRSGDSFWLSKA